jgi:hypothetical protein
MSGMEGLTAGSGFRRDGDSGTDKGSAVNKEPEAAGATSEVIARTPPSRTVVILRRELIIQGIVLVCGFVLIPLAIWAVGNRILGPYTHLQDPTAGTGPMRLLADYYDGLAHGSIIFWCVGFGPYVLVGLIRVIYGLLRRPMPAASAS